MAVGILDSGHCKRDRDFTHDSLPIRALCTGDFGEKDSSPSQGIRPTGVQIETRVAGYEGGTYEKELDPAIETTYKVTRGLLVQLIRGHDIRHAISQFHNNTDCFYRSVRVFRRVDWTCLHTLWHWYDHLSFYLYEDKRQGGHETTAEKQWHF